MTRQHVSRTHQQSKSDTPLASGILQRAAVRNVPEKDVQPIEEEATTFRESRFHHNFSRVPITTTAPVMQAESSVSGEEKSNKTGLPDNLKAGVENLSGYSLDDVRVHYNSSKPAQLQALAYTQGTEIHIAPGQEEHLPHEAWHVIQQMQGRVKPTMQMRKVKINDDQGLEREADVMGARAVQEEIDNDRNSIDVGKEEHTRAGKKGNVVQCYEEEKIAAETPASGFLFDKRVENKDATTGSHNYAVVLGTWDWAKSGSNGHAELKLLTRLMPDAGKEYIIVSEFKPCADCQQDIRRYEEVHHVSIRVFYLIDYAGIGDGDKKRVTEFYKSLGKLTGGGKYVYSVV